MSSTNFLKGVTLGLVVGSAVGAAMAPNKRHGRHMVGKALKTMGEVIENITDAVM